MIGSFPVQLRPIKASGPNRYSVTPETHECFLTFITMQEVKSNVYLPVE